MTAHPDDVDFGAAGTVAAFTSAGLEVTYCIATNGESGGSDRSMSRADMAALRQDEQRAAAAVVGVSDVRFLGHPDGMVETTIELRRDISRVIRQVRPERVLTQSPERNLDFIFASHPDHLAAGEAAVMPCTPTPATPSPTPSSSTMERLEPWTVPELWIMGPGGQRPAWRWTPRPRSSARWRRSCATRARCRDPDAVAAARSATGPAASPNWPGSRRARSAELFRVIRIP